jgi:hypothetical protein
MRVRTRALMAALVLTAMAVLPGCVGVSWHFSSQGDNWACFDVLLQHVSCTNQ